MRKLYAFVPVVAMAAVGNAGHGPTNGSTVTVQDVLPQGLTAVSMSGTGWTCSVATLSCTRSDVLAAGAEYPVITLVADVPCSRKPAQGIDTVTVTGGGDSATHTATDPTTIRPGKHCKKPKPHKPTKPHKPHRPHKPHKKPGDHRPVATG
ncbi:hypothetical protein ACR3S4_10980 [Streptomyces sp. CH8.1]|uniref:hypothetical protein n=1 Tax=Streptomyces sp. CH8.1 TaxID=3439546 RepID=UPI003DA02809